MTRCVTRCVARLLIRLGGRIRVTTRPARDEGPGQQEEHPHLPGLGSQGHDVGAQAYHPAGEHRGPVDHLQPDDCLYLGVPAGLSTGSLPGVSQDVGPRVGRAAHDDDRTRPNVASSG